MYLFPLDLMSQGSIHMLDNFEYLKHTSAAKYVLVFYFVK